MEIYPDRDIALEVIARISERHGFERDPNYPGRVRRTIDDQHQVMASVTPWQAWDDATEDRTRANVSFGIARRDINELWAELLDDRVATWFETIAEYLPFFGQPPAQWLSFLTPENEVESWIDEWVPQLVTKAPTLPFIESVFEMAAETPEQTEEVRQWQWIPRSINNLLNGTHAPVWTDLIEPLRERLDEAEAGSEWYQTVEGQIDRVLAWMQENPEGVERTLVD